MKTPYSRLTRPRICKIFLFPFLSYRAISRRYAIIPLFFAIPLLFCICGYPERYTSDNLPLSDTIQGIEIIPCNIVIVKNIETTLHIAGINANGSKSSVSASACVFTVDSGPAVVDPTGTVRSSTEGSGIIRVICGPFIASAEYTIITRPDYGALRISEVMYDPEPETGREFIEIYNSSDSSCDLTGVFLTDSSPSSSPFVIHDITLQPRCFIVIGQSFELFSSTYGREPDAFPFTFTLANTGDSVFLIDPDGSVIDTMYIKTGGTGITIPSIWGTEISSRNGYSLARVSPDPDTDMSSDFFEQVPSPGYILP